MKSAEKLIEELGGFFQMVPKGKKKGEINGRVKKLIEMGLVNKEQAEQMIQMARAMPPEMMAGMMGGLPGMKF